MEPAALFGVEYENESRKPVSESNRMPEISRFFGVLIRMFVEPAAPHHRPHFHAYYQDASAVFAIDSIEVLGGELPQRQRRFVEAWAEIHQVALLEDWQRLQGGRPPFKIDPLR